MNLSLIEMIRPIFSIIIRSLDVYGQIVKYI